MKSISVALLTVLACMQGTNAQTLEDDLMYIEDVLIPSLINAPSPFNSSQIECGKLGILCSSDVADEQKRSVARVIKFDLNAVRDGEGLNTPIEGKAFAASAGTIPSSISQLDALEELYFSIAWASPNPNGIYGTFPDELFALPALKHLKVSLPGITGMIPPSVGLATNLETIEIDGAGYDAVPLPTEIALTTSLREFVAWNAKWTEIPDVFWKAGLEKFDCNYCEGNGAKTFNDVSGAVDLKRFYIFQSTMTGTFPQGFDKLTALEELTFFQTSATGKVDPAVAQLSTLTKLNIGIGGWQAGYNVLSGFEPDFIDTLCSNNAGLVDLLLRGVNMDDSLENQYGMFDDQWANCGALENLDLSRNYLGGHVPKGLTALSAIKVIDLSENYFGTLDRAPVTDLAGLKDLPALTQLKLAGANHQFIGTLDEVADILPEGGTWNGGQCLTGEPTKLAATGSCGLDVGIGGSTFEGGAEVFLGQFDCSTSDACGCTKRDADLAEELVVNQPKARLDPWTAQYPRCFWTECGSDFDAFNATGTELDESYAGTYGLAHLRASQIFMYLQPDGWDTMPDGTTNEFMHSARGCEGFFQCDEAGMPTLIHYDGSADSVTGKLTGALTRDFLSLDCYLSGIELPHNNVTGPIPAAWAGLTGLKTINLAGNERLMGPVPEELAALTGLTSLDVRGTGIEDDDIPAAIKNLAGLTVEAGPLPTDAPTDDGPEETTVPSEDSSETDDGGKEEKAETDAAAGLVGSLTLCAALLLNQL